LEDKENEPGIYLVEKISQKAVPLKSIHFDVEVFGSRIAAIQMV
jgi:hypothetical protein